MNVLCQIIFKRFFLNNHIFPCFLRYDSSIRPIKVPVNNSPLDKGQDGDLWKAYTITCESKFSAVMPFGVSLNNEGKTKCNSLPTHYCSKIRAKGRIM